MGVLRRLMHLAAQRLHRPGRRKLAPLPSQISPPVPGMADPSPQRQHQPRNPKNVAAAAPEEEEEEDYVSFEVDWSVFSMVHIQTTIQEMLFTLAGLALPEEQQHKQAFRIENGNWRTNLDVKELYLRRELRDGVETGFLVRGVIYDMAALAIPPQERGKRIKEMASSGSRDWSNLVHENVNETVGKVEDVSAEQVMEKLGLKYVGALQEKIGSGSVSSAAALRKKKLQEKQGLEEILGRGDSIRAKYAERLRHKQALADARQEQAKLGVVITTSPGEKDSSVLPGCPALIRYLEERGVSQALLARGPDAELRNLMNQLGGFQFAEVRRLQEEVVSEGMLDSICTKWRLPAKRVLLVVGANGSESEELLKVAADKGYFVCRVQSTSNSQGESKDSKPESQKRWGLTSWFNHLAEGTLHIEEQRNHEKDIVHFRVMDMTELKWVIEDLNGVSYRTSTMVRGFK
ncbi:uncharacterized protein LOC9631906 [Selaginella moellendorffii]|nr:uncharacterized protein LOC9631906 [Selaginella moellendorffii]|eukprot:XP_002991578.2 uncharacterized protein LOC9631906 [Selaginella moellendorffii]